MKFIILPAASLAAATAAAHPSVQASPEYLESTLEAEALAGSVVAQPTTSPVIGDNRFLLSTSLSETTIVNWCDIERCTDRPILVNDDNLNIDGAIGKRHASPIALVDSNGEGFEDIFSFLYADPANMGQNLPMGTDGWISLARNSEFMNILIENGRIIDRIVQLDLYRKKVLWGEYRTSENAYSRSFNWFDQDHDKPGMWGIKSGITAIEYKYGISVDWSDGYLYNEEYVYPVYFDSGNSFIIAPKRVGQDLLSHVTYSNRIGYIPEDNIVLVNCDGYYYDFEVTIEEKTYRVKAQDYKTKLTEAIDGYDCLLNIRPSNNDFWVLGQPFMKGYNFVFDNSNPYAARVGIQSTKGTVPYKFPPKNPGYQWTRTVLDVQSQMRKPSNKLTDNIPHTTIIKGSHLKTHEYFSTVSGFPAEVVWSGVTSHEGSTTTMLPSPGNSFSFKIHITEDIDWSAVWKAVAEWFVWLFDWLGISIYLSVAVL